MPRSDLVAEGLLYGPFDKDLELRALSAAAVSASGNGSSVTFPVVAQKVFRVTVISGGYSGYVAGTAQWSVGVDVSVDGSTWVTVQTTVIRTGSAVSFPVVVSPEAIRKLIGNAGFIRVTHTKTGTPGDLTYGAYIVGQY